MISTFNIKVKITPSHSLTANKKYSFHRNKGNNFISLTKISKKFA